MTASKKPDQLVKAAGHLPRCYTALLGEIKTRIRSAQYEALKAVNKELIALYWDIGRMILQRQKLEMWGRSVVERLAADLQKSLRRYRDFRRRISGEYANFIPHTAKMKFSHHS